MLWAGCSVAGSGDPLPSELGTVNWTQPARPLPGTSEFGSALNEVNCTASKASLVSGRGANVISTYVNASASGPQIRWEIPDPSGQCTHYQLPDAQLPAPHRQLIGRRSRSPSTLAPSSQLPLAVACSKRPSNQQRDAALGALGLHSLYKAVITFAPQ